MTNSVRFESAAPEDVWVDSFGDPYCGILTAGSYVIADPGTILSEKDYDEWAELATLSKTPFEQYGSGHDGMIRSARINGHPVTGFTVYSDANKFTDTSGNVYEIKQIQITEFYELSTLAVLPTALLEELGLEYSADHVFEISEKDVEKEYNGVYYSTRTHRMFVGNKIEIYTGDLSGPDEEIEAESARDEELYAELWDDL